MPRVAKINVMINCHPRLVARRLGGVVSFPPLCELLYGLLCAPPLRHKKSGRTFILPPLVPYDILFSNKYLRDLGRIWELREIVPDPNNMPWIEKIDK